MEDILGAVRCHYLSPSFLKDQIRNCDLLIKVNWFLLCILSNRDTGSLQVPACREHLAKNFQEL